MSRVTTTSTGGGSTGTFVYTVGTNGAGERITVTVNTLTPSDNDPAGFTIQTDTSVPASTDVVTSVSSPTPDIGGTVLNSGASPSETISSGAQSGQSSVPAPSSSSGVSTGSLAGAAIGCLIGGALIAFLIAFLIFKKREQRRLNSGGYYQNNDSRNQRDVVAVTEKPSSKSSGAVMGWQAFLPQSADDRTIQNGVKTFFNLIELHVDNFYRKAPVELDQQTREGLAQIDSGKLPGHIDQLMQDQRLVLPVIKHCIADLLITRMSPLTYPETSLLPSHLSSVPTKLQSSSLSSNERTGVSQAYSQWRLLNAYLYPRPEENPIYIDDREAKANDIAELLANAFAPWRMAQNDKGEMLQHEKGLVATAGNLGILLMSQPSAFEFKWSADSGRNVSGRSLIALPGFWKNTDDQGRPLGQPQLLASPSILRV